MTPVTTRSLWSLTVFQGLQGFGLICAVATASVAQALPYMPARFNEHYASQGFAVEGLAAQRCQLCHVAARPSLFNGARNPYGKAVQTLNILLPQTDFSLIEKFDADEDGFSNLEEIFADTSPGNKEQAPASRLEISQVEGQIVPPLQEGRLFINIAVPDGSCREGVEVRVLESSLTGPENSLVSTLVVEPNRAIGRAQVELQKVAPGSRLLAQCRADKSVGSWEKLL